MAAYAGDTLWATAAFLGIGLLLPRASTWRVALLAMSLSVLVEVGQLYHAPWIDSIRSTTLGGLVLGFDFVWSDLACYAVGVGLGILIERIGLAPPIGTGDVTPMLSILTALTLVALSAAPDEARPEGPFAQRGYYITFMRMPTYDLADWKRIVDGIHDDGGNTLLLWVGGAFRSKKYPITWKYNQDHENVRNDFVRDLIDHAHSKGIKVLLGFTPFGYDGVNQYPLEHPELKAVGKDGKPVAPFGIGCWGYNLCPSRPESQRFMLEYVREMLDLLPRTPMAC